MKQLMTALALAFMASTTFAASHAAAAPAGKSEQQNKMTMCNKDAGDKKGDERKAFMKECLSAKGTAPAGMAASPACEKSADDKKLAGAARTAHIKKCTADAKPEAKKG
jgi:psiF repeat